MGNRDHVGSLQDLLTVDSESGAGGWAGDPQAPTSLHLSDSCSRLAG